MRIYAIKREIYQTCVSNVQVFYVNHLNSRILIIIVFPLCRIIMCMLCGDPYSVEYVLGPLLAQQNCYLSSGERSIAIETQLGGDTKRKVEVVLSSYHGATDFR